MTSFKNLPVLVIGGLGFIGGNLTARLRAEGAQVTVLTPARTRYAALADQLEASGVVIVEGDIRDRAQVGTAVEGKLLVFNLAGQSGAVRSMDDPWTDLDLNCRGTLVLLDAIRHVNPGAKLVTVGSRLEYGRPESMPVEESALGEPLSVHAIHKRTVEQYLRLYRRLFGLRFTIARVTNPYGPGQPAGRTAYGIINRFIHLALAGEALTLYGDGRQLRDYIHVDDVVTALLALAAAPGADGLAYNVASGTGTAMVDLAAMVIEIAGSGRIAHTEWPALAAQIETGDFVAHIGRIRRDVGWVPSIGLRDGLSQTVSHYRSLAS
ncbi:MAG: NAD-dependent epimerase/dehydratase family protein [Acidobacteriota bacterium]|nr:NAD-dependent epimerase/dehydratase family protein [Acidobacteriota bacterium]